MQREQAFPSVREQSWIPPNQHECYQYGGEEPGQGERGGEQMEAGVLRLDPRGRGGEAHRVQGMAMDNPKKVQGWR
jgi:hypothetical protein